MKSFQAEMQVIREGKALLFLKEIAKTLEFGIWNEMYFYWRF